MTLVLLWLALLIFLVFPYKRFAVNHLSCMPDYLPWVIEWWHYTYITAGERRWSAGSASPGSEATSWNAWSITQVLYRERDPVSRLLGLSSILPFVIVLFLCGLASAPSPHRVPALVFLLGLTTSVCLNVLLKSCIRSPRPAHPAPSVNHSTIHGMPSDHAQFMWFVTTYLLHTNRPKAVVAKKPNGSHLANVVRNSMPSAAMSAFLITGAVLVTVGRVYNGHHTVGQVLVGAVLGCGLGLLWRKAPLSLWLVSFAKRVVVPVMLYCTAWVDRV